MADTPLDVATREIPRFSVAATLTSSDPRTGLIAVLAMLDRSLTIVSLSSWGYSIGGFLNPNGCVFGRDQIVVPNGAEYWRVSVNLTAPVLPARTFDMLRVTWSLAL